MTSKENYNLPYKNCMHANLLQFCLTLCNLIDCRLVGSCARGILQASILEWVVMSSSRGSSQPRDQTQVSHVVGRLFTVWAIREAKNTGVGSLSLLQGIFPTQGSNPGLLHCGWILYCLSHKRSPRIREWVAYPFSSRSSRLRNQTRVSCIAGWFFTSWAPREAPAQQRKQNENLQKGKINV